MGLAGPGTFWMYVDTFVFPAQPPGDPLVGSLAWFRRDRLASQPVTICRGYRTFENEMEATYRHDRHASVFGSTFTNECYRKPRYTYKIPHVPSGEAMFNYDAFMSLANSAGDASRAEGDLFSTGTFHHFSLEPNFSGATGRVELKTTSPEVDLRKPIEFVAIKSFGRAAPLTTKGSSPLKNRHHLVFGARIMGQGIRFGYRSTSTTFSLSRTILQIPPLNLPLLTPTIEEIRVWATVLGCVLHVLW
jgi:hypothetical protein